MIRITDTIFSVLGLVLLSPVFIVLAIWIKLTSRGPVIYRQIRIGKDGQEFRMLKLRSMYMDADKRGLLTISGRDPRITPVGHILRRYKLDELPQLLNVFLGHMSLVGPRPEVKKYVDLYSPHQRAVLLVRPGITDIASVLLSDENCILEKVTEPEAFYIDVLMSVKIRFNMVYINHPSLTKYISVIYWTALKILHASSPRVEGAQRLFNDWIKNYIARHNSQRH